MERKHKEWIIAAMGLAAVFITTLFIKIPTQWGYFNLGDAIIFLFSTILAPGLSFLMASIASAAADLAANYPQYAIFTFLIKGTEGFVISWLVYRHHNRPILAFGIGATILVGGYFITDWILFGSAIAALGGVPFNLLQGLLGLAVALLLVKRVKRINEQ